ncbi:hypothetical protein [Enterococcus sp. AZ103]|uniref:hypothetical protein n=1 Tax=Enterococcus sp. AZ103 TaxID=2774628 RepID=UPI003F1EED49
MAATEKFKDWQFRYQYMYATRRSEKSKKRFIGALVTDLSELGVEPKVIEFDQQKKGASRNIYVGDLKRAKKIICTYYDTPPNFFGDYVLFDRQAQSRKTIFFIVLTTIISIVLGLAGLALFMQNNLFAFDFSQLKTYVGIAAILLFFLIFGKVTKGLSSRKNLVRNTSTILMMLAMIEENKNADIAYAFIDEGSYGERGLEVLKESTKKTIPIYFMDSVGAETPLYFKGDKTESFSKTAVDTQTKRQMNYIFCGESKDTTFYLSKDILKRKEINMANINQLIEAFS